MGAKPMKFQFILLFLTFILMTEKSVSDVLSEKALFNRCYSQITGTRPKLTDPITQSVYNGQKTALTTCKEILNSAKLTGTNNETLANTSDPVTKNILTNFHRLHSSWFYSKEISNINWPGFQKDDQDLYDTTSPSLYITRSLFKPLAQAKEILTTNENLIAVRTNMSPSVGPESTHPMSDFVFTLISGSLNFAATGDLLGVKVSTNTFVSTPQNSSFNLYQTLGGGYLGTNPYALSTVGAVNSALGNKGFKTDGGYKMHRSWGKSFYKDALCRDLPVVRESDVLSMVDTNSSVSFRTTAACTRCHASHDRVSGVVRGLTIAIADIGNGDPTGVGQKKRGGNFPYYFPVTMPAETSWSATPDNNYHQRPTNGVLFYRNFEGNLINVPVTSVADLGQKTTEQSDFYICLAKRYYSYFTGIEVNNSDPGDLTTKPLNLQDQKHRDLVVKLGKNLMVHQSLMQMIEEIISLKHYRQSDFGIKDGIE